ncbi:CHAT domain-containing protein [Streptomyces sp. NPDC014846]|uniref:CHAT domain-containing protein n=1 Tax=Streptomyces sp. NPDC014846 TaxID=3364922 RepID=UPI0036FADDE3
MSTDGAERTAREALNGLNALLRLVAVRNDPSLVLDPAALSMARQLEALDDDFDDEVQFAVGWFRWYRHCALPRGERRPDLEAAVEALGQCFVAGLEPLPEELLPHLAELSVPLAEALSDHGRDMLTREVLSTAANLWDRIVAASRQERSERLGRFASVLYERFKRTGDPADLDWSIEYFQRAWAAEIPGDPSRLTDGCGPILMIALHMRFDRRGTAPDLDHAIVIGEQLLSAFPTRLAHRPELPGVMSLLYGIRFDLRGDRADVDRAVVLGEKATQLTHIGEPYWSMSLLASQEALQMRFALLGGMPDLERAITLGGQSVACLPADDPYWSSCLASLGLARFLRYEQSGSVIDLDQSIAMLGEAVGRTMPEQSRVIVFRGGLGLALLARFETVGASIDLEAAITHLEESGSAAGAAQRSDHPKFLTNLAVALHMRFQRHGNASDLDRAITAGEAAADAMTVGQPDRPKSLITVAGALGARYERTGSVPDLTRSIVRSQEALDAVPADALERPKFLDSLGIALRKRYKLNGEAADLERAIDLSREAVLNISTQHPDRLKCLFNLGIALATRYEDQRARKDLETAASYLSQASEVTAATPSDRIRAARIASRLWAQAGFAERAADAAEAAVLLLPLVAPRRLERHDQQDIVGEFAGVASDAAALALAVPDADASGKAERALRLLESGRAVLLGQALESRSDITDLRARHPELAKRFTDLRGRLDQPPDPLSPVDGMGGNVTRRLRPDQGHERRRELSEEFAGLLADIRGRDGFASFALPPTADELKEQAEPGPIVVLNVSSYRCDALLLTSTGISSLHLSDLSAETVGARADSFRRAVTAVAGDDLHEGQEAKSPISETLEWLWDAVAGPVLWALGHCRMPVTLEQNGAADWPRVWWAPGGPLGALPIHAAGHHMDHADDPSRRTVMDRVVPSYTPTVRALRYARERARLSGRRQPVPQSLIVAMPTTPGGGPLKFVMDEAGMLLERLPDPILLSEQVPGNERRGTTAHAPTKAEVLERLPECTFVHFACHAASHLDDPSQSLLLLRDHEDDPLTVASLAPVVLDRARLAYLSACHTAVGTPRLIDEAIHLTSAFQLAGFPHVIGTLWEINDKFASSVADLFYAALETSAGEVDPDRAARALHQAVRRMRDGHGLRPGRTRPPRLWAAHLHVGA